MKKAIKMIAGACAAAVVCAGGLLYYNLSRQNVRHTSATFVMDAVADQKVYGPNGEKAIAAAEQAFREMENRLSVYKEGSDIARLNAAAGSGEAVAVEAQTYALLSQAKTLSAQAGGAFELTIAPLALAWGITTDAPRVLQQDEIDGLRLQDRAGLERVVLGDDRFLVYIQIKIPLLSQRLQPLHACVDGAFFIAGEGELRCADIADF